MTNDIPSHVNLRFTSNGPHSEASTDRTRRVSTKPDLIGALDFIRLSQQGFPIGAKVTLEMPGDYVRTWEIVDGSDDLVWCSDHGCYHSTVPSYHGMLWPRRDSENQLRQPGFAALGDFVSSDCSHSAWRTIDTTAEITHDQ